jgi:hypothetical protein
MAKAVEASSTGKISLREALRHVSFEELRPYLHTGRIPISHRRLYTPNGTVRSGPGNTPPTWWALARIEGQKVTFFLEPVVADGRVIDEVLYVYSFDLTMDLAAYETFFQAATRPAQSGGMRAAEQNAEATGSSASTVSSPKKIPTVSRVDLADWYTKQYVPAHAAGRRPSREQDEAAAKDHFKGFYVPRDWLRVLRRDHTPDG